MAGGPPRRVHVEVSMLRVDPHPRSGLVPAIATALLVLSALPAATAPQVSAAMPDPPA